jgi:RimJ/RimL family protein N-acetyltransferase
MDMSDALHTERLSLRALGLADINAVDELFSSSGQTIGDGPVHDAAHTLVWLERRRQLHIEAGLAWYGLWDGGSTFVGTCGAFVGRCADAPEIGYEIASAERGHGYAAEAAEVVTDACHLAGHAQVWATIRPANIASVRTALVNGFVHVRSEPDVKGPLDFYVHCEAGATSWTSRAPRSRAAPCCDRRTSGNRRRSARRS